MRHVSAKTPNARSAAAATELAIALPFVAFVFVVSLDFGRIYFTTQTLENCAYVGALYASGTAKTAPSGKNGSVTDQDRANAATSAAVTEGACLTPPLESAAVNVIVSEGSATVTINYDFPTITPVLSTSRIVTLTRSVKMKQMY